MLQHGPRKAGMMRRGKCVDKKNRVRQFVPADILIGRLTVKFSSQYANDDPSYLIEVEFNYPYVAKKSLHSTTSQGGRDCIVFVMERKERDFLASR